MNHFGHLTVNQNNGTDGYRFCLFSSSCNIVRSISSDNPFQLPVVPKLQQFRIEFNHQLKKAFLINLNPANPTQLNGTTFSQPIQLKYGDFINIFEGSFRFDYEMNSQNGDKSIQPSEPKTKEVIPTTSGRSSPFKGPVEQQMGSKGKSFPTKFTEENITGQFSPIQSPESENNVKEHLTWKAPTLQPEELSSTAEHPGKNGNSTHCSQNGYGARLMTEQQFPKYLVKRCVPITRRTGTPGSKYNVSGIPWVTEQPRMQPEVDFITSKIIPHWDSTNKPSMTFHKRVKFLPELKQNSRTVSKKDTNLKNSLLGMRTKSGLPLGR